MQRKAGQRSRRGPYQQQRAPAQGTGNAQQQLVAGARALAGGVKVDKDQSINPFVCVFLIVRVGQSSSAH